MIGFTFLFSRDPTGGNDPLRISIIAHNVDEAWGMISSQINIALETLQSYNPTIQMKEFRSGEIAISKGTAITSSSDDPWPGIVSGGIRDITNAISDTMGSAHKNRTQVELARLSIDKLVIVVFSIAFLV